MIKRILGSTVNTSSASRLLKVHKRKVAARNENAFVPTVNQSGRCWPGRRTKNDTKQIMKTKVMLLIATMALAGSAACLIAQDSGDSSPRQHRQGGPEGGQRPPPPPLIAVLDANHDGVIDATEIENASQALLKLDKNGDGKLTRDELRPPRPENENGGPDGAGKGRRMGPQGMDHPRGGHNHHDAPPPSDGQEQD